MGTHIKEGCIIDSTRHCYFMSSSQRRLQSTIFLTLKVNPKKERMSIVNDTPFDTIYSLYPPSTPLLDFEGRLLRHELEPPSRKSESLRSLLTSGSTVKLTSEHSVGFGLGDSIRRGLKNWVGLTLYYL